MSKDTPEPVPRHDGTIRQAHYGAGRQPWDEIKDLGWAAEFAAGNVLRYLRRDPDLKGVERSRDLRHARWYMAALDKLVEDNHHGADAIRAQLIRALSTDELTILLSPGG